MSQTWPMVPLGEALTLANDAVPTAPASLYSIAGVYSFGRGLFAREPLAGTETTYKCFHRLHENMLVLSQLKGWEGAIARVTANFDGWFLSPQFQTFRVVANRGDIHFLEWYCKQSRVWALLAHGSRGMGARRDSVSPRQFLTTPIPLPPLPEQRRIVAKVEQLAAKIEEARGLRQQCYRSSNALLSAEINSLFHVEPAGLPPGWKWTTVGSLGCSGIETIQTGPFGAQLHKHDYVEAGHPVLAIGNVQWGYIDTGQIDHVSDEKHAELSRYALAEGDVLFTRSGTVGRSAVVPKASHGWLMTGHLLRIRLDQLRCDPYYLFYGFRGSKDIQRQIDGSIRGATRAGFNTSLLSKVELPLPPLPEQRRIVAYLDALQAKVDALKALQANSAAELDALLPSVLDKAFKGEL